MLGCLGIAPISSSLCTSAAALAPLFADVCGAGEAVDGAAEVPELVWLGGAGSVVVDSVVVVCAGAAGTITGAVGIAGADMTGETGLIGLTGDSTFVGLVTDFTQVFEDVTHEPHTGCP